MPTEVPYGSWPSVISAEEVQKNSTQYLYMCQDQDEDNAGMIVYWIEMRSDGNARAVVVSRDLSSQDTINVDWTPLGFSAHTRVHEYGGADCFVCSGSVYFSNDTDQHLYKQTYPQSDPIKISQQENCRYANGFYSTVLDTIFIVREDHSAKKVVLNSIVTIHKDVEKILAKGADFYSSPKVSKSGNQLCWIEWMFPNMQWDNSRLCVANLDSSNLGLTIGEVQVIVTGTDTDPISCALPTWIENRDLCYISDESGYWNVWIAKEIKTKINMTPVNEDVADPMWCFDNYKHMYSRKRKELVVARKGGRLEFIKVDYSTRKIVDFGEHLSSISQCQFLPDGSVVALAFSSITKKTVYHLWEDGKFEVIGQNRFVEDIDVKYFSIPQHIKYPVSNSFSYGYFYPPCNPDYCAPRDTLPPLLVQVHGGPTSAAFSNLKMTIQYWTSRGYAVLDVDYRGSTGYGKEYRHSLKGNWGLLDVEDCCAGVKYLTSMGLVDENMVVMQGGSAGGYTTLCCLTFTSVFKAGSSSYGIGDLEMLLKDTHKFESRYMDFLVGDFKVQSHLYKERSPIYFPEKISCPVIFFQGNKDRVVPMEQSEKMFEAVKKAGIPCSLVIYAGEAHGFCKIENIIHNLESKYYFFGQIFGLATPGITEPPIIIKNFPL